MSIPTPTPLKLTINSNGIRSLVSPVSSDDVQDVISLLDGQEVSAKAFSETNIMFNITEKMILDGASKNRTKDGAAWHLSDTYHSDPKSRLASLISDFTHKNEHGNTLSCSLNSMYVKESMDEIKKQLFDNRILFSGLPVNENIPFLESSKSTKNLSDFTDAMLGMYGVTKPSEIAVVEKCVKGAIYKNNPNGVLESGNQFYSATYIDVNNSNIDEVSEAIELINPKYKEVHNASLRESATNLTIQHVDKAIDEAAKLNGVDMDIAERRDFRREVIASVVDNASYIHDKLMDENTDGFELREYLTDIKRVVENTADSTLKRALAPLAKPEVTGGKLDSPKP